MDNDLFKLVDVFYALSHGLFFSSWLEDCFVFTNDAHIYFMQYLSNTYILFFVILCSISRTC